MNSVSELNKQKVRLFINAVVNEGQLELIDELVAADYVGHVAAFEPGIIGPEGVRRLVSSRRLRFPNFYIKIQEQIAEDDRVATRWQATGTEAPRSAPTGSTSRYAGISIVRLLAGKQVDSHTEYTNLALKFDD